MSEHSTHWTGDEYAQPEADYTGGGNVSSTRKRSGKRSREAQAAKMRRYRAKYRSKMRAYHRRYMAQRRLRAAGGGQLPPI